MLVGEEASGLIFKGWLNFTVLLTHSGGMFLDEGYSHNKFQTYQVFLVLGSAASLMDSCCVH